MLFHLPITKVYLNRRSRLFQTYQSQPLFELPDASSQGPMLETQRWLCKFGQVLESERISIRQVKTIIFSASSEQIFSIRNEVAQIIKLAINCHPASKISNIMYYLCRRSPPFRKTLVKQLAKMCQMLPTIKSHQFQHKICIILTDMFLFGIYFTQNQFVQQILSIISYDEGHGDSLSEELIQFRLFYLCHYCQILSLPSILLQKNYRKFLSVLQQCLKQTCSCQLQKSLHDVKQSLQNIQKSYSTGLKRQDYKQQQKQLLNLIHSYEEKRMAISKTIITVTDFSQYRNRKQVNRQIDVEGLFKKVEVDFPALLSFGNQHTEDQNKVLEDRDEAESFDSGSSSSKNEEIQNEQAKAEQKLLCTVYKNCKNYKNRQIYTQDDIYMLPKIVPFSTQSHTYLQQLPQQYLTSLQNCTDMETSTHLADTFLRDYNKHGNRAKLVYSIMKELYQRNNLVFIVRVLAMIYKTEKKEIDELIKQQVDVIRDKCAGKIGKSQYGRYGEVIVEMNKFDMMDTEAYLTGLLHLVSQMTNRSPQKQPLLQPQTSQPLHNFSQPITFQQLLALLEKLDRDIYYKSLACHIIFNQIIQVVRNHIKNRKVGYDFQIVNRFNGLVNYLQEVRICRQDKLECKEIIQAESLKENRVFRETVRKFQDELGRFGKKEALNKIVRILVDSIQSQNYIDSYLYADLVYQINSRKLDIDIKQATIRQILQGLNNGNYQGAANWSRFYGQLHRYKVISQNELIVLLQDILLNAWFQTCPAPATKVICSALDTCWHYMKSTKKISEINQTLRFLFHMKHQLLKSGGLMNTMLEYEIEQILENIHTSFKYIRSVQNCLIIEKEIQRNGDLELVMNDYELMCKKKQMENQRIKAVASHDVALQDKDKSFNVKYVERQKQEMKLIFKPKDSAEKKRSQSPEQIEGQPTKLNLLQLTQLQTNSSQHETEKNLHSSEKQSRECIKQQEKQVKKMKVIGRMKNGRKIEKIEITK